MTAKIEVEALPEQQRETMAETGTGIGSAASAMTTITAARTAGTQMKRQKAEIEKGRGIDMRSVRSLTPGREGRKRQSTLIAMCPVELYPREKSVGVHWRMG